MNKKPQSVHLRFRFGLLRLHHKINMTAMNTTKEKSPSEDITVEINLTEDYAPAVVDLKEVFGAIGLSYTAKPESYGIVQIDAITENGILCLSAGQHSQHGDQTRIAVRASHSDGISAVAILKIKAVSLGNIAQVA